MILARKEVKNANLYRNLVSHYEDRYLALVNFKESSGEKDDFYLVVLKKWQAGTNTSEGAKEQLHRMAYSIVSTTKN